MLNVSYLKTYGYIKIKGSMENTYIAKIHPANALFGVVYHDTKNKLAYLETFACDYKHLENCLKDGIGKEKYIKIVIYTNTDWTERWKVAKTFQKYGYNVEMKSCKKWRKHNAKK